MIYPLAIDNKQQVFSAMCRRENIDICCSECKLAQPCGKQYKIKLKFENKVAIQQENCLLVYMEKK